MRHQIRMNRASAGSGWQGAAASALCSETADAEPRASRNARKFTLASWPEPQASARGRSPRLVVDHERDGAAFLPFRVPEGVDLDLVLLRGAVGDGAHEAAPARVLRLARGAASEEDGALAQTWPAPPWRAVYSSEVEIDRNAPDDRDLGDAVEVEALGGMRARVLSAKTASSGASLPRNRSKVAA